MFNQKKLVSVIRCASSLRTIPAASLPKPASIKRSTCRECLQVVAHLRSNYAGPMSNLRNGLLKMLPVEAQAEDQRMRWLQAIEEMSALIKVDRCVPA